MGKINISGVEEIIDIHYRYQMEKLDVKNEKNKTVLDNLSKVSTDLGRDEKMIIYFFKKYFGTNFTLKNTKYTTSKKISAKELQDALKEFIEYSILCPVCRLPETNLKPKGDNILISCGCCGYNDKIDMKSVNSKAMKELFSIMIRDKSKKK